MKSKFKQKLQQTLRQKKTQKTLKTFSKSNRKVFLHDVTTDHVFKGNNLTRVPNT